MFSIYRLLINPFYAENFEQISFYCLLKNTVLQQPNVLLKDRDMFQLKFLAVPWDHFLALGLGLTESTEVQKVQKMIRHHIEGNFSSL